MGDAQKETGADVGVLLRGDFGYIENKRVCTHPMATPSRTLSESMCWGTISNTICLQRTHQRDLHQNI
jgi:hypothetical protein